MIIVFFHVLYLIGKIVYDNYQCKRLNNKDDNGDDEACSPVVTNNTLDQTQPNHHTPDFYDADDEACSPVVTNNTLDQTQPNHHTPDLYDADDEDDDFPRAPRFFPPAFIQRYVAVVKVLTDLKFSKKIKKVVDFGCSELGFLVYLKRTPGIQEILCIDVDRDTLDRHQEKAIPLNADYLQNRCDPLTVHIYEGSVTHPDKILENCDAVVAIELIEHLYPETLQDFPHNIFGFIKPLVAVVTTPNADFNVLFPRMKKSDLRHWDHKFEWSRQQFEDWANNIVTRYPEYSVSFEGIGAGPPGTEELGCCSQMAIFTKVRPTDAGERVIGVEGLLKKVTSHEYPFRVDNRSDEQKILDEATYYISRFSQTNEEGAEEYPLEELLMKLQNFQISIEVLREVLVNGGWAISDGPEGPVILCPDPTTFSDYDEEMEMQENNWPLLEANLAEPDGDFGTWREGNVEGNYDECWDIEYELPARPDLATTPEIAPEVPGVEISSSRSLEVDEFDALDAPWSLDPSGSAQRDRLSNFESSADNDSRENGRNSSLESFDEENTISNVDTILRSSSSMKNQAETSVRLSRLTKLDLETSGHELASICSINLESSRNDEPEMCPGNVTIPGFDCTELQRSFEDSLEIRNAPLPERLSPDAPMYKESLENSGDAGSPRISGQISSTSFRTVKNLCPRQGNESSDFGSEEPSRSDVSLSESFSEAERSSNPSRPERQRTPASLSLRSNVGSAKLSENSSRLQEKSEKPEKEAQRIGNHQEILQSRLIHESSDPRPQSEASKAEPSIFVPEDKPGSPDAPETPPNSWSPEIMDSGYPNSSSMQDTTPEYDLSSIAQDRISSDSESPSVAEAPRPGFLERAEVENGDLANNNRDGEGNNVAAAQIENDLDDDLQPLIDGLENDIENENDIYALENDFPVWLLRILERGNVAGRRDVPQLENRDENPRANFNAPGDPGLPELDEGFDSTDSENDDDDEDPNEDEESIEWNVSGDH